MTFRSRLLRCATTFAAVFLVVPFALPTVGATETQVPTNLEISFTVEGSQLTKLKVPSDFDCSWSQFYTRSDTQLVQHTKVHCVPRVLQPTKFCILTSVSAGGSGTGFGGGISNCVPVPTASCLWVSGGSSGSCGTIYDVAIGYPPLDCEAYGTTPSYWAACGALYVGV